MKEYDTLYLFSKKKIRNFIYKISTVMKMKKKLKTLGQGEHMPNFL